MAVKLYRLLTTVTGIIALAATAGCVTRIDWNSRLGIYHYDQAIAELGPPDKSAKTTDGALVAEWLVRRYRGDTQVVLFGGYGYYAPYSHPAGYAFTGMDYERYLRLTFDPEGRLTAWRNITR